MATPLSDTDELVTAAYTIPASWKARIERIAKNSDLNASQVVRRILGEHFDREGTDAATQRAPEAA